MTTEDLRGGGWAPGPYTITCCDCGDRDPRDPPIGAKRSFRCEDHARLALASVSLKTTIDYQKVLEVLRKNAALEKPISSVQPTPLAGLYDLHLYCDHINPNHLWNEFPHVYTHELGSTCRSNARRDGWKIHRDGYSTCPTCVKALK